MVMTTNFGILTALSESTAAAHALTPSVTQSHAPDTEDGEDFGCF
jgi:hypothetical protein